MAASIVQNKNSLNAGELSPSLFGRTDLKKWDSGTSTCRNFFVNYRGGVMTRPGLAYVGTCKQPGTSLPPRDIPFQFSLDQGYVLEFGDQYLRIKSDGAYVTENPVVVNSVSSAGIFSTVTPHGYSIGDWVYDTGNTGFSGLTWIIDNIVSGTSFTVTDLFGIPVTTPTPSGLGTVSRIYTVSAPYAAVDLPYLKYTQSADTMTLTCVNFNTKTEYPPYDLARFGNTNWVFTQNTFGASILPPGGVTATAQSSSILTTWYSYIVTAVDSKTGEESVASTAVDIQNNDISVYSGSNTITWDNVIGASSYNVYKATPSYGIPVPVSSLYGFMATALGTSTTDTNIIADFTVVPPQHFNPFERGSITDVQVTANGGNYFQTTVSYFITTSTGSDFTGTPVVENGQVTGFIITNPGKNYRDTDTITFSDSGGGVSTGYLFGSSNPHDGDSVILNGVQIKFRRSSAAPGYNETPLGNTLALTLQSLSNFCNASTDISLICATYTSDSTHLYVKYKTPGVVGNTYTLNGNTSGFSRSGSTLTGGGVVGTGATAVLSVGPLSGTYPSVCAYFSQRRVYGASLNNPDTYWMSQPGLYQNMDTSIPVTASDSITGTPWAQQVNGIQFLVPMPGGLVVLTGKGAWQVNGGAANVAITPSSQNATPQAYNGSNNIVPPIPINYDILYVQSKGSVARDLSYNFYVNIYTGTDLTILSNHLFTDRQILQWAWAEEPYKLLWTLRDDGVLLCLTYLKEQEVYSWTRHDTNGLFVSVCSVTEPPVDATYVITKRYVQGGWRYYSERMDNRIWNNVEDSFCVDAGLMYPLVYPNATLSPSVKIGNNVTLVANANVFNPLDIGRIIRVDNGKAEVTSYTSPTTVVVNITEELTDTIMNDPNETPVPAAPGTWSISTPVTVISGLNHLEGLTVSILADGSVVQSQTVINGSVTLQYPASVVVVGLPYTCQMQTLYLDHPDAKGNTSQNKRKLINSVGVRVEASRGLTVGTDQIDASTQQNYAQPPWTDMNEIKERGNQVFAGTAIPLYTGDYFKNVSAGWDIKGQLAFQQTYPLPASILSVIAYYNIGDDS